MLVLGSLGEWRSHITWDKFLWLRYGNQTQVPADSVTATARALNPGATYIHLQLYTNYLQVYTKTTCTYSFLKISVSTIAVSGLTKNDVASNSLIFITAGYETTATSLQFFIYNMALHPDIQERVFIFSKLSFEFTFHFSLIFI